MWIVKLWLPLSFCVSIHTENQLTKKKWQINSMNYNLLNFWYYVLILFGKKSCCNLWQIVGGDLFLSDQAVLVFRNGSYGLKKLRSIFCVYCILFKLVGWIKKKKTIFVSNALTPPPCKSYRDKWVWTSHLFMSFCFIILIVTIWCKNKKLIIYLWYPCVVRFELFKWAFSFSLVA